MDGLARITNIGFIKRLLGSHADVERQQTSLGAKMLVIDDSPTICAVLGKMLGKEGYNVLKANSGEQALELAAGEQPALIFLDVVMPGMNGFTVLRKLRHDPLTCNIPIIMISGNQQATEQFYLQRCGADDFMKKPFDRDDVCERINHLVSSRRLAPRAMVSSTEMPAEAVAELVVSTRLDETLDAIPDVAMPDAEHQLPLLQADLRASFSPYRRMA